ncbi:MAG: helix-turn-helix domain-containing protein [Oscillospiraceae bacterium]|jgi:transcriptional regulator with XRE-family HTH domain|nr:helix-turn-helix domain-containing protein [Oscillospiraceae bacterium]
MKPISEKLTELRIGYNLSQAALGKAFGVSQNCIYRYEHGTSIPHDALRKYADYFDVSADYLLGRTTFTEGKLYSARPAFLNDNKQLQQFIEMCFDPTTAASARLKEALYKMMTSGGDVE